VNYTEVMHHLAYVIAGIMKMNPMNVKNVLIDVSHVLQVLFVPLVQETE